MSFNPHCLQLRRVGDNIRKYKFINFNSQSTTFGRSLKANVMFSSDKCSKLHCEIYFKDGNIFIKDLGSQNGTFIQDHKIPSQMERRLFENDVIGFGVCPRDVDSSLRTNFIFTLRKADTVEIADESSDEAVIRPHVVYIIDESENDENTENQNEPSATDNGFESDRTHNIEKLEAQYTSGSTENGSKASENDISVDSIVSEDPSPSGSTAEHEESKTETFVKGLASKIPEILSKQQQLRRWNQNAVKLIDQDDLPGSKRMRKRKAVPPEDNLTATTSRLENLLNGKTRRKRTDEVKEKLKKLADAHPPKEITPKPKRGVKVKVTKETRGEFLTKDVPTSCKVTKKQ